MRPANVIGSAIMTARIATGEDTEIRQEKNPHASAIGKLGGAAGGKARAKRMSKEMRSAAARSAAEARWAAVRKLP